MKKTSTKTLRTLSLVMLLNFAFHLSFGQTPIFIESMGTVGGTTSIASHEAANGFDNDVYTMTSGGASLPGDIRATTVSFGYPGASAGANIWLSTVNAQYGFAIEDIDASSFYGLSLSYGYFKNVAASHANLSVDYWDGFSWITIANSAPALFNEPSSATASWYAAKPLILPVGAQINGLKIRFSKIGTSGIRIDDVKLSGIPKLNQTIVFAPLIDKIYGDASFGLTASGGPSGNPVVFKSSDTTIAYCSGINGEIVNILGAGTCTIFADQAGNGTCNAAPQASQLFTVTKAMLTATANAQSKVYGDFNPVFTATYSGFIGTDDASGLIAEPIGTTTATQFSIVGTYPIVLTSGFDDDYDFTYVGNTLTINEAFTQVAPVQCGLPIYDLFGYFYCITVVGSEDYEWEFVNTALGYSFTKTRGNNNTAIQKTWISGLQYGVTYDVRVRVKINGIWGNFGNMCTITLSGSPVTQVAPSQCGLSVPNLTGNFYCTAVAGAQDYEWEFTNSTLGYSFTRARGTGLSVMPRAWILGLQYGSTYNVSVRAKVGGVWGTFGNPCTIAIDIPTTKVAASQCGLSITDLFGYFYCDVVTGAQDYEWEFVNSGLGYSFTKIRGTNNPAIQRTWISGLQYGATYDVRVRTKVNNVWGNFGTTCTIMLSGSPITRLSSIQCGQEMNLTGNLNCMVVAGAQDYEWEFVNLGLSYSFTKTRGAGLTTMPKAWILGLANGNTYDVRVRANVGGVWGYFTTPCQITINTALLLASNNEGSLMDNLRSAEMNVSGISENLKLAVYPNPSGNSGFDVNLGGINDGLNNILITVYDMTGRSVWAKTISTTEGNRIAKINDDGQLTSGIYLVTILVNGQSLQQKVIIE